MYLLTFVPNINIFRQALLDDSDSEFVYVDKNNDVHLRIDTIPVKRNGSKTLALLLTDQAGRDFIESIPAIQIIGEHFRGDEDYTFFDDVAGRNKMKQVYDPKTIIDEDGNAYTEPKMMGVFA